MPGLNIISRKKKPGTTKKAESVAAASKSEPVVSVMDMTAEEDMGENVGNAI
jgi:hypothetical protein